MSRLHVVFDLDDMLYPERQYAVSGFRAAVHSDHPRIHDVTRGGPGGAPRHTVRSLRELPDILDHWFRARLPSTWSSRRFA